MKVKIKNIIPIKPRRLVNIDLPLQREDPIIVDKRGKRWFIIVDGHHRYYKSLELRKEQVEVKIRRKLKL